MVTVIKTIENNLLEIEDIEKALSSYLEEDVRISNVKCTLVHSIPCDTGEPAGAYLEFDVNGCEICSFDLFWDVTECGHFINDKQLVLGELIPGTPVQSILDERKVFIHGNEALKMATIHFNCDFQSTIDCCNPMPRLDNDEDDG